MRFLMHTANPPNKALHRPAIPLRSNAAAEIARLGVMISDLHYSMLSLQEV
ncbi:MAG: hypothetical protein ACRERE_00725 [Candidatus Entotheonellia bacterium]